MAKKKFSINMNNEKTMINIKEKLHLLDLLLRANEMTGPTEAIKFGYADMYGNLRFILNNPLNGT